MFRMQNNVPSVYVDESRDFQLFCRLFDYTFNGIKYDINSIININNPTKVNDRLLELYKTKLGFFTKEQFDNNTLRAILQTFPYILKYKGTKRGIELAVTAILKLEENTDIPVIDIMNIDPNGNPVYNITIYTSSTIKNKLALREVLKYIIPVGYTLSILNGAKNEKKGTSNLNIQTQGRAQQVEVQTTSTVYDPININESNKYTSVYYAMEVVGSQDIKEVNNGN